MNCRDRCKDGNAGRECFDRKVHGNTPGNVGRRTFTLSSIDKVTDDDDESILTRARPWPPALLDQRHMQRDEWIW
jgi:hypothetical protein